MTPDQIEQAKSLFYDQKWTQQRIADELGVSLWALRKAVNADPRHHLRVYGNAHRSDYGRTYGPPPHKAQPDDKVEP